MSNPEDARSSGPVRHEVSLDVRYAETDQMGVVHHANYLVWFELARTALCSLTPWPYARIEQDLGVWLMVSGAQVRYRSGARYGDTVRVAAWIEKLRSRSVHFGYQALRGQERLADGITEHIWVDRSSGAPCRIPKELEQPFRELAG